MKLLIMDDFATSNLPAIPPLKRPLLAKEKRALSQVYEHYLIEVELADKLRAANKEERKTLYRSLYDELFKRVPHHQQLTNKASPEIEQLNIARQMSFILPHVKANDSFLEIGAGSCALSRAISKHCRKVVAIDVSRYVSEGEPLPSNCSFVITDGCDIPVPAGSVDVAYSNQLMEHLHVEDVLEQLGNIYIALKPGGRYVCVTPNSVAGPWDISMYFDEVSRGFHLKEYNSKELISVLRDAGFSRVDLYAGGRGFYIHVPVFMVRMTEWILNCLPYMWRSRIALTLPVRGLLGLRAVAWKWSS
jgi:SAM-dependent methyltransferase